MLDARRGDEHGDAEMQNARCSEKLVPRKPRATPESAKLHTKIS